MTYRSIRLNVKRRINSRSVWEKHAVWHIVAHDQICDDKNYFHTRKARQGCLKLPCSATTPNDWLVAFTLRSITDSDNTALHKLHSHAFFNCYFMTFISYFKHTNTRYFKHTFGSIIKPNFISFCNKYCTSKPFDWKTQQFFYDEAVSKHMKISS